MMPEEDILSSTPDEQEANNEQEWSDLLAWLFTLVKAWVYRARILSWSGQQWEIAEEIVQETAVRAFVYIRSANRNGHAPVAHLKAFCRTTAYNVFVDRIRKEKRMIHFPRDSSVYAIEITKGAQANPEEIALDRLLLEEVIVDTARAIVRFPGKQRTALLNHLANEADLDASPSLMERALADEGIQLRDYVCPYSDDLGERSRRGALLWHARQRLKKEV
jgi:DNA-directed RNA polymerase specialized sigma24 family protein